MNKRNAMIEFYEICKIYKDMILRREATPTWMFIFMWITLPLAPIAILSWFLSSLILLVVSGK